MSIAISILGLALLIFVHECGHFFASLAVGLRPRKFYVGFPPAIAKVRRNGIEYGIGVVPLGGFVKIPGMHRPAAQDVDHAFAQAVAEVPSLAGPVDRLRRSLDGDDTDLSLALLAELDTDVDARSLSSGARASCEKGIADLGDALGPDAYWQADTWRRIVAIAAGPLANIVFAMVLFALLFMTGSVKLTRTVEAVVADTPAEQIGLRSGDKVLSIAGRPVTAETIPDAISASGGKPVVVVIRRDGEEVELGPVAPQLVDGAYRLGFLLAGEGLPPGESVQRAVVLTGRVTKEIGRSLGRLVQGEGRKDVASPIGIVQGSSAAVKRGAENYLWVLGLISLSIALLNLLPLLPLDGGHILFTVIEGTRGRFVRREIYERVSFVGLALVLVLFFIGLTNDIDRLRGG